MSRTLIVALLLANAPAYAGNYGENVGVGSSGWGGGGVNAAPSEQPGVFTPEWVGARAPSASEFPDDTGFGLIGGSFSNWVDHLFDDQRWTDHGAAIDGGDQMDPSSRGSGVEGPSPW